MEEIFRRLTWVLALTSLIICLTSAAWFKYQEATWQSLASSYYQNLNESIANCEKDRASFYCETIDMYRDGLNSSASQRNKYSDWFNWAASGALILPFVAVFLFLSSRWVITGKLPFKKI